MPRALVLLLAVTCGSCAANLYYAQPLLDVIGDDFGVSHAAAGLLVTASQVGYALGILLVLPLGDLTERRRLLAGLLALAVLALLVSAVAPGFALLLAGLALAGLASVAAQVVIAMAGDLAPPEERGRVVGTIMSGLLLGILSARTVSGLVAELGGWRTPFFLAAGLMAVLAAVLWRVLPDSRGRSALPYPALLRSVGTLVARQPALRLRMAYGSLGMASFTIVWTALSFLLAEPPFDYGEGTIGLFGLAGIVGAGAAQVAGRLADRGHGHLGTGFFWSAILVSWVLLWLGADGSVLLLLAGLLVLDLGLQGQHILNQHVILSIEPDARSRVTSAYMAANFGIAALSSAVASLLWDVAGWDAITLLGGALALAALVLWVADRARARRLRQAVAPA